MEDGLLETVLDYVVQLVVVVVLPAISLYVKRYIEEKTELDTYGYNNGIAERVLSHAVTYAEQKAKERIASGGVKLTSSEKLSLAKDYITDTKFDIGYHSKVPIDTMIARKVGELYLK